TLRLDYYGAEDLAQIVRRSAGILAVEVEDAAAVVIARRARGTPRIANRLLRRVRDFAFIKSDGRVTPEVTNEALRLLAVDERGPGRCRHRRRQARAAAARAAARLKRPRARSGRSSREARRPRLRAAAGADRAASARAPRGRPDARGGARDRSAPRRIGREP